MSRDTAISFDKCVVPGNGRVDFIHNRADKMLRFYMPLPPDGKGGKHLIKERQCSLGQMKS
jgi:hypothetical protein